MSKDFIRRAIETLHSALEFCVEVDALTVKLFKSETKCEALLAQLADFDCRLTASEAERERLQAEAVKCSAAAADMSRKLAAAESELDRLGVSGQRELICAIKALHQSVLEMRRGGDALNVSPGKLFATGGIINPTPATAPAAAQSAPVLGVYPHPPADAKFGRWEPVIGSQNPAWVESQPSNASGLPG